MQHKSGCEMNGRQVATMDNYELIDRPRRVKGSGDHAWAEWSDTPLGMGRTCLICGRIDDGYQQPCRNEDDA